MKQKLHKDLDDLLKFFLKQRQNPPAEYTYGAGIVSRPEIFSVKDLQNHLNNPLLQPEWLVMVAGGKLLSLEPACLYKRVQKKELNFIDKSYINQHLAEGAAVVLEGLDILDPRINALLARIDESFPCEMSNCVAFFSQRENEAYQGHCDTDDVLVFQLEGRKTWQLFAAQQRRYLGAADQSDEQLGPVKKEITMRPGDALYVRAGVPHRCLTPGDYSLHLSIDLGDRTPNVEQITAQADQRYLYATAPVYSPLSQVIDKYVDILRSPDFQAGLTAETETKRNSIRQFRQQMGRASGINYLSKLK
jgi:ribosomal protein L16 Arg81 hydroxylase